MSWGSVLAQLDDNRGGLVLFLLFVILPLVLRFLRWLAVRTGLVRAETPEAEVEQADPREELRRRRAERRAAESEGEDLWKRLARGEGAEPPPAPAAPPSPAPPPREVSLERELSLERDLAPEPSEVHAESLEREEEPTPLSVLGEVSEQAATSEVSLESELEPTAIGALDEAAAWKDEPTPDSPGRRLAALGRNDWRRAIVLSEVLGPPVSERMRA